MVQRNLNGEGKAQGHNRDETSPKSFQGAKNIK